MSAVMVAENEEADSHNTSGGPPVIAMSQKLSEVRGVSTTAFPGHHATSFAESTGLSLPVDPYPRLPPNLYRNRLATLRYLIPNVGGLQNTISEYESRRLHHHAAGEQDIPGDHIVVAEIRKDQPAKYYDIRCDNPRSVQEHSELMTGKGDSAQIAIRYLVLEDLSERAIDVLGSLNVPPGFLMKHLHQTMASRSADTFRPARGQWTDFPWRWDSHLRFQRNATIFQTTCPVDVYLVPSLKEKARVRPLSPFAENSQAKGYPHTDTDCFQEICHSLATQTFMDPTISKDVGPYLPLHYMVHPFGDHDLEHNHAGSLPKFTFERLDTVTVYSPDHTEIPTVLVLRPPTAWNSALPSSMLTSLGLALSNNRATQWQTAQTEDPFYVRVSELGPPKEGGDSISDAFHHKIYAPERASSNLCHVLVDMHLEICGTSSQHLFHSNLVARVLLLERSTNVLLNRADDDWKTIHGLCNRTELGAKDERLRLEYFDRRATRASNLDATNGKTLRDLTACAKLESQDVRQAVETFLGQLAFLKDQTDEVISRTRLFLGHQLASLSRNEQEILFQNQIDLSKLQIRESQRAIQQTETVRKLTLLAFVFIPAGTVCSFFGMNVKELDDRPRIWIFIVSLCSVLLLVLLVAMASCFHTGFMRFLASLPTLPLAGGPRVSKLRKYTAILMFILLHVPYAIICFSWRSTVRMWTRLGAEGKEYYRGYDDQLMDNTKPFPEDDEGTPYYRQGSRTGSRLESYLDCFRGDDQDHIVT